MLTLRRRYLSPTSRRYDEGDDDVGGGEQLQLEEGKQDVK